jgi:hypothetical protein
MAKIDQFDKIPLDGAILVLTLKPVCKLAPSSSCISNTVLNELCSCLTYKCDAGPLLYVSLVKKLFIKLNLHLPPVGGSVPRAFGTSTKLPIVLDLAPLIGVPGGGKPDAIWMIWTLSPAVYRVRLPPLVQIEPLFLGLELVHKGDGC